MPLFLSSTPKINDLSQGYSVLPKMGCVDLEFKINLIAFSFLVLPLSVQIIVHRPLSPLQFRETKYECESPSVHSLTQYSESALKL